ISITPGIHTGLIATNRILWFWRGRVASNRNRNISEMLLIKLEHAAFDTDLRLRAVKREPTSRHRKASHFNKIGMPEKFMEGSCDCQRTFQIILKMKCPLIEIYFDVAFVQ